MKTEMLKSDRCKIDFSDDETMRRWARNFRATQQEIAAAIDRVVKAAGAVRNELGVKLAHE